MRYVQIAALAALSLFSTSEMFAQGGQGLSITNYLLVNQQPAGGSLSSMTFSASLVNPGPALGSVTATLTSLTPNVQVVPGQDKLHFSPVPGHTQVGSNDTFTVLVDRTRPFDFSSLSWTFQTSTGVPPIANPGANQSAQVGHVVTLNGSGSTNPSGVGTLTYSWAFASKPAGSNATLSNPTSVTPTFVPDVPGTYVVTLTVSNGTDSASANVTISTTTTPPPVANAGPSQTVNVGATVVLNGSASTSSGGPLTYSWTLITLPAGSTATLSGANTVSPSFVADKAGNYVAQLIVNDGTSNSTPSTVTITTQIAKPVANAGPAQVVAPGAVVQLNGAASTDVNGKPLTYKWTLITVPQGSTATLSNPNIVNPTFTADKGGTYVAQLIVNNGVLDSDPSTVMITTATAPPTANAGPNQTVAQGTTVQLNGSGTDPQNLSLTYKWTLISKPAGSAATLSSTVIPNPTFVADVVGNYVAQLVVSDGLLSSAPSTVTISTTCAQPTANAGPSQNVPVGVTVTLDGSASGDTCHDALTYSWTFTNRPAGSAAVLTGANSASPQFVADVAGVFVVQLIVSNGLTSNPSTVTITAGGAAILLEPNPLNLGSTPGTMNVVLASNVTAPGGQVINLVSSNTAVATVPATVTIPQGSSGANFAVTPAGTPGTTTISASAAGLTTGTAIVNAALPTITVQVDPGPLGTTHTINGTITLSTPAPAGGLAVNLATSPSGIITVAPTTINVPAGLSTASFTVTGNTFGQATITASAQNYASGTTSVNVTGLGAILLPSGVSVGLGQSAPFPVKLVTGAPVGGVTVSLVSSDPTKVSIDTPTVFIPFRSTVPDVQPNVTGVGIGTANITASAPGFTGDTQAVQVTVGLTFSPQNVTATGNTNLNLVLSTPAPAGGLVVNLASSDKTVGAVPNSVIFNGGALTASVPVQEVGPGAVTITASAPNVGTATANIVFQALGSINLSGAGTLAVGQTATLQVSLTAPAPASGVLLNFASSDTSKVTISPGSILISPGATTPATQPQLTAVGLGTANITVSAQGYTPVTQTENVSAAVTFTPPSITITAPNSSNLTLTLSTLAPAGGLTVSLSSDKPSVATVPATVTFLANTSTVIVPVTAVSAGDAVIHAGGVNVPDATAAVHVVAAPPGNVILAANTTIPLGPPQTYTVTLSSPAPGGGVTVLLLSSDASKVTITPASVFIAAGATTPSTQPQIKGVDFGSATITASAAGYSNGTGVVTVNAASATFSPTSLTLTTPATQNITLTLSAPAPAAGLTVNLSSSNPAVASVPATVFFAGGANTANVLVSSVAAGTATIHASALPNIADTTATITVVNPSGILLPTNVVVQPGQTADFPVTLAAGAPAGGLFISLSSSDPSKVTIAPSAIIIPAGATASAAAPKVTGVGFGSATIVATAFNFGSASANVQVTGGGNFSPQSITITGTMTQVLALSLSSPAPPGGVTVNLSSSNTAVATVPATVFVPQNNTNVNVPITGVAPGTAVIHANSLPIIADTTALVTVVSSPSVVLPSFLTVGTDLQAPLPVSLSTPAPAGGVTVTLKSSDPTQAFVTPTSLFIDAGQTTSTTPAFLVGNHSGLLGFINVTATAPGYAPAALQVHVTDDIHISLPDGLTVGLGQSIPLAVTIPGLAPASGVPINLFSSDTSKLTVSPTAFIAPGATTPLVEPIITGVNLGTVTVNAQSPNYTEAVQQISVVAGLSFSPVSMTIGATTQNIQLNLSGPAPAGGLTVNLFNNNPGVLSIPSTATFPAGATSVNVPLTGLAAGSALITAAGNSPNLSSGSASITVNPGGVPSTLTVTNATVGQNLEVPITIGIPQPAPAGGQQVTVTSADSSKLVLGLQQTDNGSGSVNLTIPSGQTSAVVYAQALGSTGTVNVTASAAGLNSGTGAITLTPSGFVLSSPGGIGTPFTSSQAQGTALTVSAAQLDSSFNFVSVQALRGGFTTSVNVTSSSPNVGSISVSPVTFTGGVKTATTQFNAVNTGSSTLTAVVPSGFNQPGQGKNTVTATVTGQTPLMPANVTVGKGLEAPATVSINGTAPAGGLVVTLTSNDTSKLLLSPNATSSGNANIQVTIPQGSSSASFFVYGVANSGTASYTAPQMDSAALRERSPWLLPASSSRDPVASAPPALAPRPRHRTAISRSIRPCWIAL